MKPTPWLVMAVLALWGALRGVEEAVRMYVERAVRGHKMKGPSWL